MELELAELRPAGVAARARSMLVRERAARHGIALSARCRRRSSATWVADERKVKQVVFNLLSNAVKFTPGRRQRDAARATCGWRRRDRDRGDRHRRRHRARGQALVFEEFRQVGGRRARKPKARAWAWRSPSDSSSCTAERSASKAHRAEARPLRSCFHGAHSGRRAVWPRPPELRRPRGRSAPLVDRRQTGLGRKVDDARPVSIEERRPEDIDAGRAQAPRCGERGVGILRRACIGGARHQAQQAGSGGFTVSY